MGLDIKSGSKGAMMQKNDSIFVAGHRGLVGSAIVRSLQHQGYHNLLLSPRSQLDLTHQQEVNDYFKLYKPDYVFIAAAKVGGIHANNTYRGEFIYQNLMIQTNIMEAARVYPVKRLLFLGSSCIYPRECPQPMREEHLLTSTLEKTNEAYAIAKIAGIKMCESYNKQYGTEYASVMPTNLYGPHDNFDLETSHVLPALLRKFHDAKMEEQPTVTVWGTGNAKREFLHVDDMASACVFIMNKKGHTEMLNIGSGVEISIAELADLIASIVGYKGKIIFDRSKPDGTPRKYVDTSRLNQLGWEPSIPLRQGIEETYRWYLEHVAKVPVT
jgi:GDP-L-fucose synthase